MDSFQKAGNRMRKREMKGYSGDAYLGIDSGSTTTKIAVTDGEAESALTTTTPPNGGDPIGTVGKGLERLAAALPNKAHRSASGEAVRPDTAKT